MKIKILAVVLIIILLLNGCSQSVPLTEDVYTEGDVYTSGNVYLMTDNTSDLGKTGSRWRAGYFHDLYVSGKTLYIGDYTLEDYIIAHAPASRGSSENSTYWGDILGTLSAQVDLQDTLDSKETPAGAQAKVNAHSDNYTHSDIASNTASRHSHSNKTTLDAIQEAFTTSLKSSYDWLVTNITSTWKATVDNHVSSAHAPSNAQKNSDITKGEIEAKLTGEISSHTHPGGSGESEVVVVLTADRTNATTSFADITGLTFTPEANKTYIIEAWLIFQSSATACGIKISANGPAPVAYVMNVHIPIALTLYASDSMMASRAYNTGTPSASVDATNSNLLAKVDAVLVNNTTSSPFTLRFGAETTGTVTIKAGSVMRYRKVD